MDEVLEELRKIDTRLTRIETKFEMTSDLVTAFVKKTNTNSLEIGKIQTHTKYSFKMLTSIFLMGWAVIAAWVKSKN